LAEVVKSVSDWRMVARHASVGLHSHELDDFAPAFEHAQLDAARKLLG
jgi:serine/threonine-protein kinase HipA